MDLLDSFKETDPYLMTRKNFYKVIFMTADELFFLFFTHALPLSPRPRKLFPSYSILQGGLEGEIQNIFEEVALFYEGTQKLQLLYFFVFYFISFAKIKQTNRKNVGWDTATAVANYSGPGY